MNRGEIWTAAGGVYASKPRPVLIMQDDRFDATESVVVVPMTTHDVQATLTRVPIEANTLSGIAQNSFAMVDKITTVRRANLGHALAERQLRNWSRSSAPCLCSWVSRGSSLKRARPASQERKAMPPANQRGPDPESWTR